MADASARYWELRAEALDAAAPRSDDHRGGPVDFETGRPLTRGADQVAIARRLTQAAEDCRGRAEELRARQREEIW